MASVLDQLPKSTLSLQGNGFNPQFNTPAWGYVTNTQDFNPATSKLHDVYSVSSIPPLKLLDFNKMISPTVRPEARLDELDKNAPNNTRAGIAGSVVSLIYKSPTGRRYRDLGPQPGRY